MYDKIFQAAESGDIVEIQQIVRENPECIRKRTDWGDTPLHIACYHKQVYAVQSLIMAGADVNSVGGIGRRPLHCAVHDGDEDCIGIVAILMSSGANPQLTDENGVTVEMYARQEVIKGLDQIINLLEKQHL